GASAGWAGCVTVDPSSYSNVPTQRTVPVGSAAHSAVSPSASLPQLPDALVVFDGIGAGGGGDGRAGDGGGGGCCGGAAGAAVACCAGGADGDGGGASAPHAIRLATMARLLRVHIQRSSLVTCAAGVASGLLRLEQGAVRVHLRLAGERGRIRLLGGTGPMGSLGLAAAVDLAAGMQLDHAPVQIGLRRELLLQALDILGGRLPSDSRR